MKNESGFTPTGDLVLILPPPPEEKTAGGLVLTKSTLRAEQQATRYGAVLAMGDTAPNHPRMKNIKVGDQVLFPRYAGDEFPVNKVTYFVMRAENVMGKMEKAPDYALNAAISNLQAFGGNDSTAQAA